MNFEHSILDVFGSVIFAIAIIHTFLTSYFQSLARKFSGNHILENVFHLAGEVEIVFGFWAGVFIFAMFWVRGWNKTVDFTDRLNFAEPIFVFAVMTIASTKPIIQSAQKMILKISRLSESQQNPLTYFFCLVLGPLLGSFITEPAAMTVTALILYHQFYSKKISVRFQYVTIAVLFVNVSIGGVLTHYAAPPVLMVADTWDWNTHFMFYTFGWKAVIAVIINALGSTAILYSEMVKLPIIPAAPSQRIPLWLNCVHVIFLIFIVLMSRHSALCLGGLLFFMGITTVTRHHQSELNVRQSLLVAFFLAGLVILGQFQSWWLSPLLERLSELPLFIGATILTSFTDNAALTYLGSQVHDVSEYFKYALVAGAVTGGGLTVIANAPNPAGFSILQKSFGPNGISPVKLFLYGLLPTLVAASCFWFLR